MRMSVVCVVREHVQVCLVYGFLQVHGCIFWVRSSCFCDFIFLHASSIDEPMDNPMDESVEELSD